MGLRQSSFMDDFRPTAEQYKNSDDFKALIKAAQHMGAKIDLETSTGFCKIEYKSDNGYRMHTNDFLWGQVPAYQITYFLFRHLMNLVPETDTPILVFAGKPNAAFRSTVEL